MDKEHMRKLSKSDRNRMSGIRASDGNAFHVVIGWRSDRSFIGSESSMHQMVIMPSGHRMVSTPSLVIR
eukprot:647610-Rhodomonas_salina.1